MQIRKRNLTLGLAAALLAAAAPLAFAQGPGDGGPGMGPHRPPMERAMGPGGDHGRWWNEQRIIDQLKLTDAQRKSMDDIYQQHRLTLVDLHATLEKAELGMEPMMGVDQPDETKILAQIDRIAQARAELEKANARMLLGLRKVLTPEQWKQLRADRMSHHGREGREGGGPEGRGQGQRWGGHSPNGSHVGPDNPPPPPSGPNGSGPNGAGPNGPGPNDPGEED